VSADPVLAIFGGRVTQRRKALGWSLRDLGREAGGLAASTILRAERGDLAGVGLAVAVRIADALRVPLGDLVQSPACAECWDRPPEGFTCNACGARSVAGDAT
jgi:transcriptional regulator with XRE-family HTH domain